jgi:hypothetical protein
VERGKKGGGGRGPTEGKGRGAASGQQEKCDNDPLHWEKAGPFPFDRPVVAFCRLLKLFLRPPCVYISCLFVETARDQRRRSGTVVVVGQKEKGRAILLESPKQSQAINRPRHCYPSQRKKRRREPASSWENASYMHCFRLSVFLFSLLAAHSLFSNLWRWQQSNPNGYR